MDHDNHSSSNQASTSLITLWTFILYSSPLENHDWLLGVVMINKCINFIWFSLFDRLDLINFFVQWIESQLPLEVIWTICFPLLRNIFLFNFTTNKNQEWKDVDKETFYTGKVSKTPRGGVHLFLEGGPFAPFLFRYCAEGWFFFFLITNLFLIFVFRGDCTYVFFLWVGGRAKFSNLGVKHWCFLQNA